MKLEEIVENKITWGSCTTQVEMAPVLKSFSKQINGSLRERATEKYVDESNEDI